MSEVVDLLSSLKIQDKKSTGLLIDLNNKSNLLADEDVLSSDEDIVDSNEGEVYSDEDAVSNDNGIDNTNENILGIAKESDNAMSSKKDKESEDSDYTEDGYDPDEQFRKILTDAGLKRGVKAITESFFNGEIDNPKWLHYVLTEAGIAKKYRTLILMSYYGKPPKELGISDDLSTNSYYKRSMSGDADNDITKDIDAEIRKNEIANLESVKRELAMKKFKKEALYLDKEMSAIGKEAEPEKTQKMRTVHRPLFDENGGIRKDNQGRIIAERVTEPVMDNASSSDPFLMMTTMMQMMDSKKTDQKTADPEIAELKHMVTDLALQQKEVAHKAELERIRTEKETAERTYSDNLKRMEDETRNRMEREHTEHMRMMDDLKRSFDDKLEQRDQLSQIAGAYEKRLDEMKEDMRAHQSTVKDTVVGQASKTADKMTSQVGTLVEGAVGPITEMLQQQYQTNLELFKKQNGLNGDMIPSTSEEELASYINDE